MFWPTGAKPFRLPIFSLEIGQKDWTCIRPSWDDEGASENGVHTSLLPI
jgi:hypothetical protein